MKHLLLPAFFIIFLSLTEARGREIVFLGLSGQSAPSIEKSFDKILREQISIYPYITLIDYVKTQRYRSLLDFERYPVISSELLNNLSIYLSDSTLLIWGNVEECTIEPIKQNFLKAAVKGTQKIKLTIYNIENHKYIYVGEISSVKTKPKGWIFLGSLKNSVHVSAIDRTEILMQLQNESVERTVRLITSLLKNEKEIEEEVQEETVPEPEKEPSISDVFSIPSLEAAAIDSGLQKSGSNDTIRNEKNNE